MINETSTLNSLGVDKSIIHSAHENNGVKHDEEFLPIKTKTELAEKLTNGHIVVAVTPTGSALISRDQQESLYINRDAKISYIITKTPDPRQVRVSSIKLVLSSIGKGKYYASKGKYYDTTSSPTKQGNRVANARTQKTYQTQDQISEIYGTFINKAVDSAITRLKAYYSDNVEELDEWNVRKVYGAIKELSRLRGGGFKSMYDQYLVSIKKYQSGFGSIYAINNSLAKEIEADPLFKQKFVKFVKDTVASLENSAY